MHILKQLVVVSVAGLLVACAGPEQSGDTPVAGDASIELSVGGTTFPNTAGENHWLSFAEQAEQLSDDQIKPKMLIYGQLGPEEQIISGLRRGRVQFANVSAMALSTLVPESALLYAPYLFNSEAEADFVFDNYLTDVYREMLAEKGLHLVSWYEIGFLQVYGKQPLLVPADVAGKRFRVGAGPAARLFAQSLNADVIPLGFSEVVSGLQTGLVEAGENSVSLYARTGIAPEAPHLTLTNHSYGVSMIVVQKKWWDAQSPEIREVLSKAYPAPVVTRADVRAESSQDLKNAQDLGIKVHVLNENFVSQWREATASVNGQLAKDIGGRAEEILQLIQEGRKAFSAQ